VEALVEEAERLVAEGIEARLAAADAGAEAAAEADRLALFTERGEDVNSSETRVELIRKTARARTGSAPAQRLLGLDVLKGGDSMSLREVWNFHAAEWVRWVRTPGRVPVRDGCADLVVAFMSRVLDSRPRRRCVRDRLAAWPPMT